MKFDKPRQLWNLQFEGAWPTSVAFLGDNRIAAGNRNGQLLIWQLPDEPAAGDSKEPPSLLPERQLVGHTNGITRLRASRDGKTLYSSSLDHTVRRWDTSQATDGVAEIVLDRQTREREARRKRDEEREKILNAPGVATPTSRSNLVYEAHQEWVLSLDLAHDETKLASGDAKSRVVVWDVSSGKAVSEWSGHPWNDIVAVGLSPDGNLALVSEYTYKRDDFDIPAAALKLWNVDSAEVVHDMLKLQFPKLDPEKTTYGSAQVWRKFVAHGLIAVAFSPDQSLVAAGQGGETNTGQLHLFDVETGKLVRTVGGHRYGVCDVRFSKDGKHLLSSGRDTTVRVTQVDDGKEVAAIGKERGGQFKDWIHAFDLSPDESLLAAADIAGAVQVWRLTD